MPLPLTVSCFSKIQIGYTFLVPAHPGSPGQRAVKWVCVCVAGKTVRSSLARPALSTLTASQTQHEAPYEGPVCFTLQYITNYESAVSSTLLRCRQTKYQLVTKRQTLDNYLPRRGVGRCRRRADCCTHWTMSDEPGRQSHTHTYTQPLWLYLPLGLKFQTRKF